MRTTLQIFFISLTLSAIGQVNSSKHISRLRQLKPVIQLYDSIVQVSGWFIMDTYYNQMNCSYYVTTQNDKFHCQCGDTILPCNSTVNAQTYQRLFNLMQSNKAIEIASTTWPDLSNYSIRVTYKLNRFTGNKHSYVFAIGKVAIADWKKTMKEMEVAENIYLHKFNDH